MFYVFFYSRHVFTFNVFKKIFPTFFYLKTLEKWHTHIIKQQIKITFLLLCSPKRCTICEIRLTIPDSTCVLVLQYRCTIGLCVFEALLCLLQITFCFNKVPGACESSQSHVILVSFYTVQCVHLEDMLGKDMFGNISYIQCGKVWGNCGQNFAKFSWLLWVKSKGFPYAYSITSVGLGADPGVQAVSCRWP